MPACIGERRAHLVPDRFGDLPGALAVVALVAEAAADVEDDLDVVAGAGGRVERLAAPAARAARCW